MKRVERKDFKDAYAFKQAKQRKDANVSRQAVLKKQREEAAGDPIRGITTPFVESFDIARPPPLEQKHAKNPAKSHTHFPSKLSPLPPTEEKERHLNNFITKDALERSLDFSRLLTEPSTPDTTAASDPAQLAAELEDHERRHENAERALNLIIGLENTSSKDRTRINIQRVIDKFGRHNTDQYLKPKAPSTMSKNASLTHPEPTPRAGPDVGSSEVQIGILTAKIRVLADRYQGENRMDKANKRNLRLLLHRRQKLLKYMQQRERGSERWQYMIQTLGLTEATWKGEIEVR